MANSFAAQHQEQPTVPTYKLEVNPEVFINPEIVGRLHRFELPRLVELACKTCWTDNLTPVAILIRSRVHNTTLVTHNGQRIQDEDDWHITISAKDARQAAEGYHTTYHGYVEWETSHDVLTAKPSGRKPDWTLKGQAPNQKACWPEDSKLRRVLDRQKPNLQLIYQKFCTERAAAQAAAQAQAKFQGAPSNHYRW